MKKHLITISLLLIAGCTTNHNSINKYRAKLHKPFGFRQAEFSKFRQDNMIGCTIKHQQSYLTSPFRITPIPKTRIEYQQYKVINSKLGKYYE